MSATRTRRTLAVAAMSGLVLPLAPAQAAEVDRGAVEVAAAFEPGSGPTDASEATSELRFDWRAPNVQRALARSGDIVTAEVRSAAYLAAALG